MSEEFGLPAICERQLENLTWNVAKNDIDAIIVIVGREGLGKSVLALKIALFVATVLARYLGGKPSDYFGLENASFDEIQYISKIYSRPNYSILLYDEAAKGMYARRSMSGSNVAINMALFTCRNRNMTHIICIPNYFALDQEVRNRRVTVLLSVYGITRQYNDKEFGEVTRIEKGFFDVYADNYLHQIYRNEATKQIHWPKTPLQALRFADFEKKDGFWESYSALSSARKREIGMELIADLEKDRAKDRKKARKAADDE